ncbi:dehydration-responsive element-binding protein 1G-like [Musa acuminata AAA Group]|uniref:dehydration-responsive element-binding protein 1G-like n=1 Tax=Musa acuminata AAA Group TaxID=214697 RepID=UPI0031E38407
MDTFYGGDGAAASSGSSSSSSSPSSGETWLYSTVSQAPPKRPAGRTKFRETRHPVYKGVRRRGAAGRWVCEVREPNKKTRIWLGTFPTAEMAARAHDVAAMMLRGRSACLNFADSAWRLRVPPSFSSSRDIARAAAEAAEAFRPSSDSSGDAASPPMTESSAHASPSLPTTATPPPTSPEAGAGSDSYRGGAFDMMNYDDMDLGYCYYSSMAEELLVEPLLYNWDDVDAGADLPLWSYSI